MLNKKNQNKIILCKKMEHFKEMQLFTKYFAGTLSTNEIFIKKYHSMTLNEKWLVLLCFAVKKTFFECCLAQQANSVTNT